MAAYPKALLWRRLDTAGAEQTLVSDRKGLRARGTMVAASPVPFTCRYELVTDESWATVRCEVTAEGAGFLRSVRLERATGRWRVTASEQGNLEATLLAAGHPRPPQAGAEDPAKLREAIDVDLGFSPLTNTLPIRRLGLLGGAVGARHTITVAWILVPSLEVVDASQTYRLAGDHQVRFVDGSTAATLEVDEEGYVIRYPDLAERV